MSLDKTEEKGGNLVYVVKEIPWEGEELKKITNLTKYKNDTVKQGGAFYMSSKARKLPNLGIC